MRPCAVTMGVRRGGGRRAARATPFRATPSGPSGPRTDYHVRKDQADREDDREDLRQGHAEDDRVRPEAHRGGLPDLVHGAPERGDGAGRGQLAAEGSAEGRVPRQQAARRPAAECDAEERHLPREGDRQVDGGGSRRPGQPTGRDEGLLGRLPERLAGGHRRGERRGERGLENGGSGGRKAPATFG